MAKQNSGRRRRGEVPQMRHHKPTGRAYVYADGRRHYLGAWDSPESRREYKAFIGRWESANAPTAAVDAPRLAARGCLVGEYIRAFMVHAKARYRLLDGTPTDEAGAFAVALRPLAIGHASRPVDDLTGRDLLAIVDAWRRQGQARVYINRNLGRIQRAIRWGVPYELVTETTAARLSLVRGLPMGAARETAEVEPVPLRDLVATLRRLEQTGQRHFADLARLGYYCGARPGELVAMRADEIHRGAFRDNRRTITIPDGFAVFKPTQHKTRSRGQSVYYVLGPRAQSILAPWLASPSEAGYLFRATRTASRPHYTEVHYSSQVGDAAVIACGRRWSPGRLRHNFLTRWDQAAGLAVGSAAVRHRGLATTAIYVQRDLREVCGAAETLG